MKANKKFFKFTFVLNLILGLIGFGILAIVGAVSSYEATIGFIICAVIFALIAVSLNIFIVKRSKLLTKYFLFGSVINIIFYIVPSSLIWFL